MAPFCKDDEKYEVVEWVTNEIKELKINKNMIANQNIKSINIINGIRFELENGSWGLIRASSNKPSLVIVIESFVSNDEVELIFNHINDILNKTGKVGKYDQQLAY